MDAPTVEQIRDWSTVRFVRYGIIDDDQLQERLDRAIGYVSYVTGQRLDSLAVPDWATLGTVESLMRQVIQMRTEQVVVQGGRGHVSSAADNEVVQSFTAGSYSEARRDPHRAKNTETINTWPALDELLWMLLTDDRYAWWLAFLTGEAPPDFWVEEVEWKGLGSVMTFFEPWDRWVPAGFDTAVT